MQRFQDNAQNISVASIVAFEDWNKLKSFECIFDSIISIIILKCCILDSGVLKGFLQNLICQHRKTEKHSRNNCIQNSF